MPEMLVNFEYGGRMMRSLKVLSGFGAVSLALASIPASAAVLKLDGGWKDFEFAGFGSLWTETFEFILTDNAQLKVTDAFTSGDLFLVFINGDAQGFTSFPETTGDEIGSDYSAAFLDPRWSSASYLLGPGSYTVSGQAFLSPFGQGRGAVRLVSVIPEPATWLMLVLGFGAMGQVVRARRTRLRLTYS